MCKFYRTLQGEYIPVSLYHVLGTGVFSKNYVSFEEAKKFARDLGIKSVREWWNYCKSGKRPKDKIPAHPQQIYEEWVSWGDFLGTGKQKIKRSNIMPYKEVRDFVRGLGIKTSKEYQKYCVSGKKPRHIPSSLHLVYKDKGWKGWRSFFGTDKK